MRERQEKNIKLNKLKEELENNEKFLNLIENLKHEQENIEHIQQTDSANYQQIILNYNRIERISKLETDIKNLDMENKQILCDLDRLTKCDRCTIRRQLSLLNIIVFVFEFVFVCTVTINSVLVTLISNRAISIFGFNANIPTGSAGIC